MGDLDPVYWDEILAVTGPPAPVIEDRIDRLADELSGESMYEAVKAVHDSLATDPDADPTPPDQGEVDIVAYLLEKQGIVEPGDGEPSLVERRPERERLAAMYRDPPRTMWWLGVRLGVHWALVRYWLYEADVPLRERNFGAETMAAIREHRGV